MSRAVLSASLAACNQQPGQTETKKEIQANEQASSAGMEAEQRFRNARAAADDHIASSRMDFVKAGPQKLERIFERIFAERCRTFALRVTPSW